MKSTAVIKSGYMPAELALSTDFYELTMAAAYFESGMQNKRAIFELYVRKLPRNRSYMVAAGLAQALEYLQNLKFDAESISFLKSHKMFSKVGEDFFSYLAKFKFTGNVWAVPEGTVLFPNEPILQVEGSIIEAQVVETFLLSMINFQSLIATKASRITDVTKEKDVVEFGSRRAHGPQAGLLAARASYIGGCVGTSNTLAGYKFCIPVFGTMAHSYVMSFDKEIDAFREFMNVFPEGFVLVDTYDSLKAVKKITRHGLKIKGIRLDSGDLGTLSKKSRKILDKAGLYGAKIMVSGDLNEKIIKKLLRNKSPIDIFGVGTELSTSRDDPAMNGVYKLVAIKNQIAGDKYQTIFKQKTSSGKKTYPGQKQIYRELSKGKIYRDVIGLVDEKLPDKKYHKLLKKVMEDGQVLFRLPSITNSRNYHNQQKNTLPDKFRLLTEISSFPVSFSDTLEKEAKIFKPT